MSRFGSGPARLPALPQVAPPPQPDEGAVAALVEQSQRSPMAPPPPAPPAPPPPATHSQQTRSPFLSPPVEGGEGEGDGDEDEGEPMGRLNIVIPEALKRELQHACINADLKLSKVACDLFHGWLDRRDPERKERRQREAKEAAEARGEAPGRGRREAKRGGGRRRPLSAGRGGRC